VTRRTGVLAAAAAVAALTCAAAPPQPTVIVLSWDGARFDALERASLPGLARLEREGARAAALVPPFPSNTFPSHVTLATGTHPDRHGIVGNEFLDPERGEFDYDNDASWIEAEPLWVAAERQGVPTATFFWVGSETPWRGVAATHRKTPFSSKVPESEKVDQILAWLDLPGPERPRLILSWWHGADRKGHRRGAEHRDVTRALEQQDAELMRLLAGIDARGLWPATTLIVVSDHGMVSTEQALDPEGALDDADVEARVIAGGGMASVHLDAPADLETARKALALLPGVTVFARDELPEHLRARHPRMGDLILLTSPPAQFAPLRLRRLGLGARGTHGFDPSAHEEMHGIFLALGLGVAPGTRLPRLHAVDLAPTVAALLGIDPPAQSEGQARLPVPGAQP
jgi:predicted AlkP superfamily pyrophosphatase or phosphodiesterase